MNGIKTKIRDFVSSYTGAIELNDEDLLFEEGIVNSLFTIKLVHFVEKTFNIEIEAKDLDLENFKSIQAISNFVQKNKLNVL